MDEVSLLYRLDLSQLKDESLQNSILYYYFRLPPFLFGEISQVIHKYGDNGIFQKSYYKDRLVYQNISHGFLKVMSDIPLSRDTTKKSGIEIALFKYQDQNIIAANFPDFPFINFMRLDDVENTWYDIDHEIFPNFIHEDNGGCWKKDGNYDLDGQCNVFFKLPEYGTQILGIRSNLNSLENPEAFWQDKLQNAPEEIIRLNWQGGKFVIEAPTPKR
ncbi:MAG: hypothetical protein HC880_10340 [Bacteroidia bacterium]|nr:hypothetical protein [Bacteroidia bacterium]